MNGAVKELVSVEPEGGSPDTANGWYQKDRRLRALSSLATVIMVGLGILGVLAGNLNGYALAVIYFGAYYAVLGQSWNIVGGILGYISLGQIGIFGFGAYVAVITANATGNWLAIAVAVAMGSLLMGILFALPALRVHGIVFAFTSLFLLEIVRQSIILARPVTGGLQGIYSEMFLSSEVAAAGMILLVGISSIFVRLLQFSSLGRHAGAIRSDQPAAEAVGIHPSRTKLILFAVSGLVAGAGGAIHGLYLGALFPTTAFAVQATFLALALPVIGGLRTALGPVIVGVLYALLQEVFQVTASNFVLILMGAAILISVRLMPDGLVPAAPRAARWVTARFSRARRGGTS